ncbi:M15 family metallopeptidase [Saccharospirillum mangrovi]|uniref:M15 family metallopeptidase n=1 Tax=Saccharospirillum mangrovi TaxID=2161747 RepID=UPI0013002543|nr:M15 family metallopeptidase [Saccharospirillum mangrovi]
MAAGTGYATLDMIRRSSPEWAISQAEKARKAAEDALKSGPVSDEGALASAPPQPPAQPVQPQPTQPTAPIEPAPATPASDIARQRTPLADPAADGWRETFARQQALQPELPQKVPQTPQAPVVAQTEPTPTPAPAITPAPQPSPQDRLDRLARQEAAQQSLTDKPIDNVLPTEPLAVNDSLLDESQASTDAPVYVEESQDQAEKVRQKVEHFEYDFSDDVFVTQADFQTLVSALERINRVQAYVGHGNFNIIAFDDMVRYARYQPRIGEFTPRELDYLEQLFYDDVRDLGFFGERVISRLDHRLNANDIQKIQGTGHFLLRGQSESFYNQLRAQVGDSLILTSGVRGVVKQYHLFMAKVVQAEGNISRASRSLAPPGHSYHAIGDFDVGRVGGGLSNFTSDFAETDEYKRLRDLGFVHIRYTQDNEFGVRFEPWHIRVV